MRHCALIRICADRCGPLQRFQPVGDAARSERLRAVQQDQSARRLIGEALECRDTSPLEKRRGSRFLKSRIMDADCNALYAS